MDETEEKHCKWSKATADDIKSICKYRHVLDSMLEHMVVPTDVLRCDNVNCNNPAHTEAIDDMCSVLMLACKLVRTR